MREWFHPCATRARPGGAGVAHSPVCSSCFLCWTSQSLGCCLVGAEGPFVEGEAGEGSSTRMPGSGGEGSCFVPVGQIILLPMAAKGENGPPAVIRGHHTDPPAWPGCSLSKATSVVLCLVAQSCLTRCNSMDCSPPGSSVQGDSPGKNTGVGCHAFLQEIFLTQGLNPGLLYCRQIIYGLSHRGAAFHQTILEEGCRKVKVLTSQSCPTLCDSMDCSPAGSSIHGISRARILEWMTFPSRGDLPDPGIKS